MCIWRMCNGIMVVSLRLLLKGVGTAEWRQVQPQRRLACAAAEAVRSAAGRQLPRRHITSRRPHIWYGVMYKHKVSQVVRKAAEATRGAVGPQLRAATSPAAARTPANISGDTCVEPWTCIRICCGLPDFLAVRRATVVKTRSPLYATKVESSCSQCRQMLSTMCLNLGKTLNT